MPGKTTQDENDIIANEILIVLEENTVLRYRATAPLLSDDINERLRAIRARLWPHQPPKGQHGDSPCPGQHDRRKESRRRSDAR